MAPTTGLDLLTNPLVTADQLSRLHNGSFWYATDEARSMRFKQAQLTQAAGVLLRLPQNVIAQAIVILQRFWIHEEPRNLPILEQMKSTSAAALYLTAKLSFTPVSPRSTCNVYAYLMSPASPLWFISSGNHPIKATPEDYFVSEGTYERERQALFAEEQDILGAIGFDTHVALPHTIALTYLQALGATNKRLTGRVLEHLNGALLSPQILYLTHQPNALAAAAIYLAARETGTKLVDDNWWDVFDVDREDLGFLVHAYNSLEGFVEAEKRKPR